MADEITLSSATRNNLLSLQNTSNLIGQTQQRLAVVRDVDHGRQRLRGVHRAVGRLGLHRTGHHGADGHGRSACRQGVTGTGCGSSRHPATGRTRGIQTNLMRHAPQAAAIHKEGTKQ